MFIVTKTLTKPNASVPNLSDDDAFVTAFNELLSVINSSPLGTAYVSSSYDIVSDTVSLAIGRWTSQQDRDAFVAANQVAITSYNAAFNNYLTGNNVSCVITTSNV